MKVSKKTKRTHQKKNDPVSATAARMPWWAYAALSAVALVALFVAYGPALSGPFVFDDQALPFLDGTADAHSLKSWLTGVRPVLMASYWVNYQSGGTQPYGYKVVNLLLHFLNGVL